MTFTKLNKTNDFLYSRFNTWKSNSELIKSHNSDADKGIHTFWLGMNRFGDLTAKEFASIYNGYNATLKTTNSNRVFKYDPSLQVPDKIDWRTQGYVTDVKDQGQCGKTYF